MARYPDHTTPPVPMSDEQKFFFDLRGWLVVPAVLTAPALEALRDPARTLRLQPLQLALLVFRKERFFPFFLSRGYGPVPPRWRGLRGLG